LGALEIVMPLLAHPDTNTLIFILFSVMVFLLFVSLFYAPNVDHRPHRLVTRVVKKIKRPKSAYNVPQDRQALIQKLQQYRDRSWSRCPYCGSGKPDWSKPEVLDFTDAHKHVVSVLSQTCQQCGHVQFVHADWIASEKNSTEKS
jgi:hypothetical protein